MYLDSDSEEEQVTMLPSELGYEAKTDLRYDKSCFLGPLVKTFCFFS